MRIYRGNLYINRIEQGREDRIALSRDIIDMQVSEFDLNLSVRFNNADRAREVFTALKQAIADGEEVFIMPTG